MPPIGHLLSLGEKLVGRFLDPRGLPQEGLQEGLPAVPIFWYLENFRFRSSGFRGIADSLRNLKKTSVFPGKMEPRRALGNAESVYTVSKRAQW